MSELLFYDLKNESAMVPSLSSQVTSELGRRIVAGVYEQGSLVQDERALAERFHVSRSVIRDAVKILVGKGLLEVRRGIGTRVRPRENWMLLDNDVLAWHHSSVPQKDYLHRLSEVRVVIEPKAARWAAQRADSGQIDRVNEAFLRMEKEKGSVEDFVISDSDFHREVLRASRNDFLAAMDGIIFSALLMSIRLTNQDPRDNEKSIPFHREVANAIARRDADRAEQVMIELLEDARMRLDMKLGTT